MEIGFIGPGNMGRPMARRLIEAGHKLVIYDTRNDAAAPLVTFGAQLGSSPAAVVQIDSPVGVMVGAKPASMVTEQAGRT